MILPHDNKEVSIFLRKLYSHLGFHPGFDDMTTT